GRLALRAQPRAQRTRLRRDAGARLRRRGPPPPPRPAGAPGRAGLRYAARPLRRAGAAGSALRMTVTVPASTSTRATPDGVAALDVRGARYAYPDGTPGLRGVDLEVQPGEKVALLGPNGA